MSTQLKKFLQIYEFFTLDPTVFKQFPMLASPRLYLDIFFQIYGGIGYSDFGTFCGTVLIKWFLYVVLMPKEPK